MRAVMLKYFREHGAAEPTVLAAAIAAGAGWPEEAEALLTAAERFDLMALLLERQGQIRNAIDVSSTNVWALFFV